MNIKAKIGTTVNGLAFANSKLLIAAKAEANSIKSARTIKELMTYKLLLKNRLSIFLNK